MPIDLSKGYPYLKVHAFISQFGMLIEYLFEKFPNPEDANEAAIGDLQVNLLSPFGFVLYL